MKSGIKKFKCTKYRCVKILKKKFYQPHGCLERLCGKCTLTPSHVVSNHVDLTLFHNYSRSTKALEVIEC